MKSLVEVEEAGHCIAEWARWQQGGCCTYAVALIELRPHLRFGTLFCDEGIPQHHFAHDDEFAYDSAGKHPLPYLGIFGQMEECRLDEEPEWYYDIFDENEIPAAKAHAQRWHKWGTK